MASLSLPAPGTLFGDDFKIVKPLKEGGMGAVYVAEQLSTGALRALKLMHPGMVSNATLRRRFEQEARVGAQIESDYVVNVIGAGVDDASGIPWLAMELLQGEDLEGRMDRVDKLSPAEACDIFRPLCHALGAAHVLGIVHRDLKPANIFLAKPRRPGEAFTLKILDYGIARITAEAKTAATGAVGTPLWMAPEQTVVGGDIGPATDVWALGLIAFFLLTGTHYWRSANRDDLSLPVLIREVAIDALEPASARAAALGSLVALPAGFDAWFARCVVRELPRRFANATEAFAALAPVLGDTTPARVSAIAETAAASSDFPGAAPRKPPMFKLPTLTPQTAPGTAVTNAGPEPRPRSSRIAWIAATIAIGVAAGGGYGFYRWRASNTIGTGLAAAQLAPTKKFGNGTFDMGSNTGAVDEAPVRHMSLPAFELEVTEVTVEAYHRCVAAGHCSAPGTGEFCTGHKPQQTFAKHPINCVDYQQATDYCAWIGRRLPSEEEWEFAAGGKAARTYPWGAEPPQGRLCWGRCSSNEGTCEVGTYPTGNTLDGLKDMAGNVQEWTSSTYCPYDKPECGAIQMVARGGGWCGSDANAVRVPVRQQYAPTDRSANVGIRCAKTF